jgi:S1-C subfamily serine protease
MQRLLIAVLFLFGLVAPLCGDAIPIEVLTKIKAATVFVKAKAGPLEWSGSGFVFQVDGKTALIATNEHVAVSPRKGGAPATVDVVFDSGRKNERVLRAEVLATDPDRDLAVLRVKEVADLPAPISFSEKLELVETLPVLTFGFPFGAALGTEGKNPAITVGKGSVSSLREDKNGRLKGVQIDGGLNPGNSGGPVVDEKGRLVGVAVAGVRGTQIGLAIPAAELTGLLRGRVASVSMATVNAVDGVAEVRVEIQFIDPLNKITKASVLFAPTDSLKEPIKIGENDVWPAMPGAQEVELKIEGQKATGVLKLPSGGKSVVRYSVQPVFVNGDKTVMRTQPARPHSIDFVRAVPVPEPKGIEGAGKVQDIGDVKVKPVQVGSGIAPACLCWSADGKSFYHLDGKGTVRRIAFPDMSVEGALETDKKCTWLTVSAQGPIVTVADTQEGWVLDPKTLQVVKKIAVGPAKRVVSSAKSNYAYADQIEPAQAFLKVIDLKEGKIIKQYRHSDFEQHAVGMGHLTASPDGRFLFSHSSPECMTRFRIEGADVIGEENSPRLMQGRFEGICVANDGEYVCAPAGGGNYPLGPEDKGGPYRTFIYNTKTFKKPAVTIASGPYPLAIGFDIASGLIYAENHGKQLMIFDANGIKLKELDFNSVQTQGSVRQFLVHPEGRKMVVLVDGGPQQGTSSVVAVQLPKK